MQFTNVATGAIGTTSSQVVNLEDASGAGVSGYGWQDNGYGAGVLGPDIVFSRSGTQRLRIQNREDGFVIDQIVLSSSTYLRKSPGALKNDSTMLQPPSSTTPIRVPAGADLQAALNAARSGDTLVLASGARYVGNIELPPNDGPDYITVTSDANVPPAGTRVSESLLGQLAIIQSPNGFPAVQARTGANYYRFVGVVFRGVEGVATSIDTTRDIVSVGDGTETDAALLPSHFVFDRVLIRGDATYGAKRGILGNGHDITLEYSDIRTIFRNGQDTSGFGCYNCGKTLSHSAQLDGGRHRGDPVWRRGVAGKHRRRGHRHRGQRPDPPARVEGARRADVQRQEHPRAQRRYQRHHPPQLPGVQLAAVAARLRGTDHREGLQENRRCPVRRQRREEHRGRDQHAGMGLRDRSCLRPHPT